MMARISTLFLLVLATLAAFHSTSAAAQSIVLTPGSLVLSDALRTGDITVANTEDHRVGFRVEPTLFRMRADGFLDEVASLPLSAAAILRFAPRQFELEPGEAQIIKVAFRAPADLAAGEYRLHLRLRNMGAPMSATPVATAEAQAPTAGEVNLQVPVTVARAVRILVRHGTGPGSVAVSRLDVPRADALSVHVNVSLANQHSGGSASGVLVFEANVSTPGRSGEFARRRYSVYADLDQRDYQFQLLTPDGKPTEICVAVIPDDAIVDSPPSDRRCTPV